MGYRLHFGLCAHLHSSPVELEPRNTPSLRESKGIGISRSHPLYRDRLRNLDLPYSCLEFLTDVALEKGWTLCRVPDGWSVSNILGLLLSHYTDSFRSTCIVACIRYSTLFHIDKDVTCRFLRITR